VPHRGPLAVVAAPEAKHQAGTATSTSTTAGTTSQHSPELRKCVARAYQQTVWQVVRELVRILTMSETVPFTHAKAHLSELVDRVATEHDRVVVTRNGHPVAVLISVDELEGLEETLDLLSDEETRRSLQRAQIEDAAGKAEVLTLEQARERFQRDR
jgi:antitoxin YefM